jgi:peptidoglycan hydrolase CwlO-like protein
MSKVQIYLSKALKVNLGQDENGQQINVDLPFGLQEVDAEVAEHWFVKAHSQEIPQSAVANQALQAEFEQLQADHAALQAQSDAATKKIAELEKQAKADVKTIAELNKQIADAAAPEKAK